MTNKGQVLKMAPLGKKFEKMDMLGMAKLAGCAYVATVVPNNPRRVESVIKKAILIARAPLKDANTVSRFENTRGRPHGDFHTFL